MRSSLPLCLLLCVLGGCVVTQTAAAAAETETILFIRHAEKPPAGLGQLSCKGLNRALALAGVMQRRFPKLGTVFAPNPSQQKPDGGPAPYDYVRPLATVEPTAIRFGLPVHAEFGYAESDKLLAALGDPALRAATVLVAWEHHQLDAMVPRLLASFGGPAASVPKWAHGDYDSIWRVTVTRDGDKTQTTFAQEQEGLNGQPDACPQ